mmetsp:Transcript_3512/g.12654  ORF Transcript_3512/g.12654 Transcript_3512/m.12654 type:complete len:534 (+) Transcript_3512:150-1751(+)
MARVLHVLILLSVLTPACCLRGVAPEALQRYGSSFKCGSKVIAKDRINDDFCDCLDGTDEPGTNACANGRFYCRNNDLQPRYIFSTMVNDHVCDCCDGSDEYSSGASCPNTCLDQIAEDLERMRAQIKAAEEGLTHRKAQVELGIEMMNQRTTEIEAVDSTSVIIREVLQELKAHVSALEEREKGNEVDEEYVEEVPPEAPPPESAEDESVEEPFPEVYDHSDGAEEPQPSEEEKSAEELGMEVAARWGAQTGDDAEDMEDVPDEELSYYDGYDEADDFAQFDDDAGGSDVASEEEESHVDSALRYRIPDELKAEQLTLKPRIYDALLTKPPDWNDEEDGTWDRPTKDHPVFREVMSELRRNISRVEGHLRQVERGKDRANELITMANEGKFGPDNEFFALADTCFSFNDQKYTYNFCIFGDVRQTGEGANNISLGSFKSLEWDNDSLVIEYTNGLMCPGGPARSLKAAVECGSNQGVRSISEPSRCEYAAELVLAAACTPMRLQELKEELKTMEHAFQRHAPSQRHTDDELR